MRRIVRVGGRPLLLLALIAVLVGAGGAHDLMISTIRTVAADSARPATPACDSPTVVAAGDDDGHGHDHGDDHGDADDDGGHGTGHRHGSHTHWHNPIVKPSDAGIMELATWSTALPVDTVVEPAPTSRELERHNRGSPDTASERLTQLCVLRN
jgi:hypothetical protein